MVPTTLRVKASHAARMIALLILAATTPLIATDKRSTVRTFTGRSLQQIAFPIGGIGTGSVSLGGRGELRDWEIFNRPDKGSRLDFTFFALWAQRSGRPAVARVLERKFIPPFRDEGGGLPQNALAGLPRLDEAVFHGEYPYATVEFHDASLPVRVTLEAWNPFIPLDVERSALPVAIFTWTLENPSPDSVRVSLAASMVNPIGDRYTNVKNEKPGLGFNLNRFVDEGGVRGIVYTSNKVGKDDPNFGSMALLTTHGDIDAQTRWYRGGWWDRCHIFWDDFSSDGALRNIRDTLSSEDRKSDVGSIALHATIPPHASVSLPIYITWYFPNRENYWNGETEVRGAMMKNYVAGKFGDALAVGKYVAADLKSLDGATRSFHDALFSSTMPPDVIDAVSSQMSTLKTNVCILLEDGSFFGFEGNDDNSGCCPLNCTHVWNYEQTLAFLFPQLERSMRETDFRVNTLPGGYMTFRTLIPTGRQWWKFKACADGQMGCIVKAYREWKLSGDTEWLRGMWTKVKSALEFAWRGTADSTDPAVKWTRDQVRMPWDPNKSGVLEGEQHNTYDIEFYGPNSMTGSLYLAALKAAAEMADSMGEASAAAEYRGLFERGKASYEKLLWHEDYYVQDMYVMKGLTVPKSLLTPPELCGPTCCDSKNARGSSASDDSGCTEPKYQYGEGCLSDQLLGQYLAHVAGLGYVLDSSHVRVAMKSIYNYNFRKSMAAFPNVQRVYAVNDEAGLLLCSWPHGNRPALPFVYSDEVWTGIEYQVAASLIYNGWIREGLEMVRAVRARYNGERRNPWDEEECGHHYARAMASWSLLLALSGYHYDGSAGRMSFAPRVAEANFRSFWSSGSGWGTFRQQGGRNLRTARLDILYGDVKLNELLLSGVVKKTIAAKVTVDGKKVEAEALQVDGGITIRFRQPLRLERNSILEISL